MLLAAKPAILVGTARIVSAKVPIIKCKLAVGAHPHSERAVRTAQFVFRACGPDLQMQPLTGAVCHYRAALNPPCIATLLCLSHTQFFLVK
jgi:hypothetical protein